MSLKKSIENNKNYIIKITVSLLIIIFLLNFINYDILLNSIKNINYIFIYALALLPLSIFLRAYRWMIMINKDIKCLNLFQAYELTLVGVALNIFLPASFGDVAKSYYGFQWHGFKEEMLASSVVDKFMALFSLFVIGFFSSLIMEIYAFALLSLILGLIILAIIFFPEIVPWEKLNILLSKILKTNFEWKKLKSSFNLNNKIKFYTFSISIIGWVITYFQLYLVCLAFNLEISYLYILAVAPLITLAVLFPLTLNGIGSGEVVMIYLFSLIGLSPTLAVLISFIYSQLLTTIIPGVFGFLIILIKK